jgi:hypothetical protein
MCGIEACGLGAHTPHGLCWVHHVRYVVGGYKPDLIDSLPIKRALRCRLHSGGCTRAELAEILGVASSDLNAVLRSRRVWMRHATYDKWATLLHLDLSPLHEVAA